jgi:DNA-binding PadR family transcriptional regulator
MTRTTLGELEHQVLLAAFRLKGEAYSVSVVLEIEARTGREVAQAAVFIALRRLEAKGLLRSRLQEQRDEQKHVRRYFEVTPSGLAMLREMRRVLKGLWQGISADLEGAR